MTASIPKIFNDDCPQCHGYGYVQATGMDEYGNRYWLREIVPCCACGGTGEDEEGGQE